jgi:hypothetical protein
MGYLQLSRRNPRGYKGSRIQGWVQGVKDSRVRVTRSEASALNAKELQRPESL